MQTSKLSRRAVLAGAFLSLAALPVAGLAAEPALVIEGQSLPRQVLLAGQPLRLNGAGLRGWYKAFIAALYLPRAASTAAQATAQAGPKRLQLRMLYDLPAGAFAEAFRKGVTRNAASADETAALEPRIVAFESTVKALGKVRKGDVIDLDLDPVRGTLFSVNGTLRGSPIKGEDFYSALLRAFIGERPYDDKMKAGLLGR